MSEIVIPDILPSAEALYLSGEADIIIEKIRNVAANVDRDAEDPRSRDFMKSISYKIAQVKSKIDAAGKSLTDEWRNKTNEVNAERKRIFDTLDTIQKDVRQPLTDWENAEKARKEFHEKNLQELQSIVSSTNVTIPVSVLRDRLNEIQTDFPEGHDWQEYAAQGASARVAAIKVLEDAIVERERYDAEQAELEEFRRQKAEQQKLDDEKKASEEADKRAAEALDRQKKAEQEEQDRLAKDKAHKAKVHNDIIAALLSASGLDEEGGREIFKNAIKAIASGKVPNVKIIY